MLDKFANWLNKKDYNPILEGVFGSWTYHVPEDRQQQMYDFYMLEYLLPPGIHMYLKPMDFGGEDTEKANALQNKEREEKGLPPDTRHYGDMSMTVEDKFYHALYEVGNKLLPALKKELLEAVMFSISAELRHLYDSERNKPKLLIERVKKELGPKEASLLRNYTLALRNLQNPETAEIMDRIHIPTTAKNSDDGYTTSYKALKHAGGTDEEWAKLASWLFYNAKWGSSYGGKAWGGIADGWTHLNDAETPNKIIAYIDHVYDLQHNTGSVFTKLKSYRKDNKYDWIQKSLDHKRDLVSPHEMFEHISPSMREVAKIGIKLKTGKTFLDFEKDWPEILKKKAEIYNQMQQSQYEKKKAEHEKNYPNDTYWESKPKDITPEQYASQHIINQSVSSPVTGNYGPAPYSMGQVNQEYWAKVNKGKPVPQPTYTGTPINQPPHPSDVDIGDKVKIIGGSSGYVGQTGTVIDKIYKYDFPYFNVEFADKPTKAFKRHRFEVVEKKASSFPDEKGNKVGDHVIITHGTYNGSKGVLKSYNGHSWSVLVTMPHGGEADEQWYSSDYFKKDDSASGGKSLLGLKVGDHVTIKYGSHKGMKGFIKNIKAAEDPYPYQVDLGLVNLIPYSNYDLQKDEKTRPSYKVGDPVIITNGDYKGKKGEIVTSTSTEGVWIVAVESPLDSKKQNLYFSQGDLKKDDSVKEKEDFKAGDPIKVKNGLHTGKKGKFKHKTENGNYMVTLGSSDSPYLFYKNDIELDKSPTPEVGDIVKVIDGSFAGFTGTVKVNHGTNYTIALDIAFGGKQDQILAPNQFEITGKKGQSKTFEIGATVKVTGGEHNGITGVVKEKIVGDNLYKIKSGGAGYEYLVHAGNLQLVAPVAAGSKKDFKVGDFVKVKDGMYAGLTGHITKTYTGAYKDNMVHIKFDDGGEAPIKVVNIELSSKPKKEFKNGDPVKIINGYHKGMVGTIVYKIPQSDFEHGYSVKFPSGGSYAIEADDMELATAPAPIDTGAKIIDSLKNSFNPLKAFLFPMDLKVARAIISTKYYNPSYPIEDILTKVNAALGANYSPNQLFDIKKTYLKELAIQKYFDAKTIYAISPLSQEKAHEIMVQHYHDMPGKPFLDKKTIMDMESKIEQGDKIQAIKLAREALGWNLKSAKEYIEYLTFELATNGIYIKKVSG
jgi:transcription antitermination factor NusG/ribosomal protein L7/L12